LSKFSRIAARPEQALMVGDSSFDLLMARNAGMASVAVSYGAQSIEALQQFEPRLSIDRFSELHAWLGSRLNTFLLGYSA
jgi:phosphoglycolate phosphatase